MPTHLFALPDDKTQQVDLVHLFNQLAAAGLGITVQPALVVTAPDDAYDIFLRRLGAKRLPDPPQIPAPEIAAATDAAVKQDAPQVERSIVCKNCSRKVRVDGSGLCLKCRRSAQKNGSGSPAAEMPADAHAQEGSDDDAELTTTAKGKPATTLTDARFSEPTVFAEDRHQSQRILTRHQQPIRGHKLG